MTRSTTCGRAGLAVRATTSLRLQPRKLRRPSLRARRWRRRRTRVARVGLAGRRAGAGTQPPRLCRSPSRRRPPLGCHPTRRSCLTRRWEGLVPARVGRPTRVRVPGRVRRRAPTRVRGSGRARIRARARGREAVGSPVAARALATGSPGQAMGRSSVVVRRIWRRSRMGRAQEGGGSVRRRLGVSGGSDFER